MGPRCCEPSFTGVGPKRPIPDAKRFSGLQSSRRAKWKNPCRQCFFNLTRQPRPRLLLDKFTAAGNATSEQPAVHARRIPLSGMPDTGYGSTSAEQTILQRVFLRIVRPTKGGLDTRRRAAFTELPPQGAKLVLKLANERLLVTNQSASGQEQTVEVAHEALISNWGMLRAWAHPTAGSVALLRRSLVGQTGPANAIITEAITPKSAREEALRLYTQGSTWMWPQTAQADPNHFIADTGSRLWCKLF